MKAGYIYIKTKIDNSEFGKDLKRLKVEMDEKGGSLGKTLSRGVKKGLSVIADLGKGLFKTIGGVVTGLLGFVGTVVKSLVMGIGRIALASMGISTALGAIGVIAGLVGTAFKRIVDNNEQLLANIKYIVFVIGNAFYNASAGLATMIANAISKIINLLAKVIVYTAYIIKAWFGIDILAGSSVDKFKEASAGAEKTAKGLGKASKNAKELKKQLAGFDEMNVLQDNDSGGTGGGAGGGIGGGAGGLATPDIDLAKLQGDIPAWIKWIAENKDIVIAGLLGIAGGLAAIALGAKILMGLGIGLIIAGVVLLVQDIVKFIQDPSWENFANILRDVAIILAGIAITMIAINAANPLGWIMLAIAAVVLLVSAIIKHWDEIKAVLASIGEWIKTNVIDPVVQFFVGLWESIKEIFFGVVEWINTNIVQPVVAFIQAAIDLIISTVTFLWEGIKTILSPVVKFVMDIVGTIWNNIQVIIYDIVQIIEFLWNIIKTGAEIAWNFISGIFMAVAGWVNSNVIQPVANFIKGLYEAIKSGLQIAWNFIVGILKTVGNWINTNIIKPVANFFKGLWDSVVNGVKSAYEKIKSIFSAVVNFFKSIISTIVNLFKSIGTKVGNVIAGAFKGVVNGVLGAIENILNSPIRTINSLIGVINQVPGLSLKKLSTFRLPRLAKGGIINQPGRGVMIGSAIAGEAGREGVIPLTDSQQMELLGEAIGRYITVNASITNTMNGRVISRELQKINNENDFAFNR